MEGPVQGVVSDLRAILQSEYILDHFTAAKKLRVIDIKQLSQGETQSKRCRGGIHYQVYTLSTALYNRHFY